MPKRCSLCLKQIGFFLRFIVDTLERDFSESLVEETRVFPFERGVGHVYEHMAEAL